MDVRKKRALTEQIRCVKLDIELNKILFHILGSRNVVYEVLFSHLKKPECSCPDCKIHGYICKHIYFVCCKIFNIEPSEWNSKVPNRSVLQALAEVVSKRMHHLSGVLASADKIKQYNDALDGKDLSDSSGEPVRFRNEECIVCLCDMKMSGKPMVCGQCRNGIHAECWRKWTSVNYADTCVYCRTPVVSKHSKVTKDQWGIQLL
jgi:hypothetical protein